MATATAGTKPCGRPALKCGLWCQMMRDDSGCGCRLWRAAWGPAVQLRTAVRTAVGER